MIWVIGGTKDSRDFLEKLVEIRKDIIVTTATDYGAKLIDNLNLKVISQKLDFDEMLDFVDSYKIEKIIDLSHPYAQIVTSNAIEVSKIKNIEYFRYERAETHIYPKDYIEFESIKELIDYASKIEENILVTLGSNNIHEFKDLKNLDKFYFRILPKWDMVKKCEDNNILPKNIIAMQGPFSENMNKAMILDKNIKYLITKKAGVTGGELEKIKACDEMNVKVLILSRPKVVCENFFSNLDTLLESISRT